MERLGEERVMGADPMEREREEGAVKGDRGRRAEMEAGAKRDETGEAKAQQSLLKIFTASSFISAWPAGESRWTKQVSSLKHTHTHHCPVLANV